MSRDADWRRAPSRYEVSLRDDGATVELWTSQCQDCGFVSGMASVSRGGRAITLSGAGCHARPRRDLDEARRWADAQLRAT